jgi:TRAP-type C4-dicarboxylate transport system permease small subunit
VLKILEKCSSGINKAFTAIGIVFLAYLVFSTAAQVFFRYVLNSSASWTEETARYSFVWLNMMGASIAVRYGSHVGVDIIAGWLTGTKKKIHRTTIAFLILFTSSVFVIEGIRLTLAVTDQFSPAVAVPISLVYLAIPVGGVGMVFHSLLLLVQIVSGQESPEKGHAHG